MTNNKILVTGAAGLAGAAVIREFVRNGHQVRALVRNKKQAGMWAAYQNVEVVEGDMTDAASLVDALVDIDKVLLISSSTPDMLTTQKAFIDIAKAAGVRHIIKFSGLSAADEDSSFIFATLHAQAEKYLEQSGVLWTHLRPSQFATEYLREVPTIVGMGKLLLPFGDARLTPVDVTDVAKAAYVLLTTDGHEGKIYEMSGPQALTMNDVASAIADAIERPVEYVSVNRHERNQMLQMAGVPEFFVDVLDAQVTERLKGRESVVYTQAHVALGIPATSFAEFAQRNAGVFLGESNYVGL